MKKMGKHGAAVYAALATALLSFSGWAQSFTITYHDTEGQVGHHMTAWPGAKCPGGWNSDLPQIVSGSLPPGLSINDNSEIVGTPRQPGKWSVVLNFARVECQGASYSDVSTRVNLNIKGIAPKALP